MTYGMLIDLKKCIGCHACSVACKEAHGTRPGVRRSRVERTFEGAYPAVRKTAVPMLCMHCENAPCVEVCPQDATYKREDGIVVVDKDKCIGCGACQTACPYDARHLAASEDGYFGSELNECETVMHEAVSPMTIDKCTFCADRRGRRTAAGLRGRLPGGGTRLRRAGRPEGPGRGGRRLPAPSRGEHEPLGVVSALQCERVAFLPGCQLSCTVGSPHRSSALPAHSLPPQAVSPSLCGGSFRGRRFAFLSVEMPCAR